MAFCVRSLLSPTVGYAYFSVQIWSAYVNVACFHRMRGDTTNSFYFFVNQYKLSQHIIADARARARAKLTIKTKGNG